MQQRNVKCLKTAILNGAIAAITDPSINWKKSNRKAIVENVQLEFENEEAIHIFSIFFVLTIYDP